MDPAISLDHVSKRYGDRLAVDNLSLTVARGEVFGFLGPNGAGKTTTILMLLGLVRPTSGRIALLGQPIDRNPLPLRSRLGVMGEQQYLYDDMTAREYLLFFARLYNVPHPERRIANLMDVVGLSDFLDVRARDYSHGMQQKLGLVRALLHQPDLLILDEPVSGLDPNGIAQVRHLLLEENRRGVTIFLSSHILSEVEKTAHRVGIISRGRLVAQDTVDGLRARLHGETTIVVELASFPDGLPAALDRLPFVRRAVVQGRTVTLLVSGDADYRPAIFQEVAQRGGIIVSMNVRTPSLEEAFLTLTDHTIALLTHGQEAKG